MSRALLSTLTPNQNIALGSTPVIATVGQVQIPGVAGIELRWLPAPRVEIVARFDDSGPFWLSESMDIDEPDLVCTFPEWGSTTRLRIRRTQLSGVATVTGELRDFGIAPAAADVEYVAFHLANFPALHAVDVATDGREYIRPKLDLRSEPWLIELEPQPHLYGLEEQLREVGGYAITHHGKLRRTDGNLISRAAAEEALTWLGDLFSFAVGRRVSPLLARGYRGETAVWQEMRVRILEPWRGGLIWLDRQHGESLEEVFPGYARLSQDPEWSRPLQSAVYWFVNANVAAAGIDTAIVLAQAALELIAWTKLVRESGALSAEGFEKLTAADKIRLALSSAGIPLGIPDTLKELSKLARELNWHDGPAAVAVQRNSIVHPNLERRMKLIGALPDVWLLSQWYIELLLLRQMGFRGVYSSRLTSRWVGQVERVPWAT